MPHKILNIQLFGMCVISNL